MGIATTGIGCTIKKKAEVDFFTTTRTKSTRQSGTRIAPHAGYIYIYIYVSKEWISRYILCVKNRRILIYLKRILTHPRFPPWKTTLCCPRYDEIAHTKIVYIYIFIENRFSLSFGSDMESLHDQDYPLCLVPPLCVCVCVFAHILSGRCLVVVSIDSDVVPIHTTFKSRRRILFVRSWDWSIPRAC